MIEGFDISNNNPVQQVRSYIALNDPQFCFMKASEGESYRDKVLPEFYNIIAERDIVPGFYHFAKYQGNIAKREAENFLSRIEPYMRHGALLALDVEAGALKAPNDWIREWVDTVEAEMDGRVIIYIQKSAFNGKRNAFKDNGLWIASWGDNFQKSPFYSGYLVSFHQTGLKDGLDHDVFFGNREQLEKYKCYYKGNVK